MSDIDLSVNVGGLELANPITVASGTFGTSDEYEPYCDFNKIGAIITKSITLESRIGNKAPRIWETAAGMINAIGLENKGAAYFIKEKIPYFEAFSTKLIVSLAGNTIDEYQQLAQLLNPVERVDAIEINISCPNVKHGGIAFVQDNAQCAKLVKQVRKSFNKPIFVKISPEAKDFIGLIDEVMRAGANGISLINTLKAMAVDIVTKRPRLGNVTGGLSGPAIKPVALRYLFDLKQKYNVPVIAGGGIMSIYDALEFLIVGAEALSLGTANFVNPRISEEILQDLLHYCEKNKFYSLSEIRGTLRLD